MYRKTSERPAGEDRTERRFTGKLSPAPPRHRNEAMRDILARAEIDLTAERGSVRSAVERTLSLFSRTHGPKQTDTP